MGFTYRDNYVKISTVYGDDKGNFKTGHDGGWKITGGTFQVSEFDVTKGQDPREYLKVGEVHRMNKDLQFLFRFGRHGDSGVASSFNKLCPPKHNTFNHTAGKLNFWVKGTLTLEFSCGEKYTFPNTYLAQGHSGASNNWWFGNDELENSNEAIIAYDHSISINNTPVPIYLGNACYGAISPLENSNLIFQFKRGSGADKGANSNSGIDLVGVYYKDKQ